MSINPSGFQWFDLTKDDPQYILEQSKKAEKKLKQFIDEIKSEYNLKTLKFVYQVLVSSLNVCLTRVQVMKILIALVFLEK